MKNIIKEKRNVLLIVISVLLIISLILLMVFSVNKKNVEDELPQDDVEMQEAQYNGGNDDEATPLPDDYIEPELDPNFDPNM